jgi:bifunctional polynucleotide phosphatase/kinase
MDSDIIIQTKKSDNEKLAIFDFDGTIVKPKEGRTFPKDVDDWQYTRVSVPKIIKKYSKTKQIVIVTDQSKSWKIDMIKNVMKDLDVEYTAIIGVKTKKPNTSLFNIEFPKFNKERSFYVGDATGKEGSWSDVDKKFAEAIGVVFFSPEELFPLEKKKLNISTVKPKEEKEVVIMVGYPASGKSTIAKTILKDYYRVDGDSLKTIPKMIKDARAHVDTQSIVFDSTGGTKERRKAFIDFAKEYNLPVRVFWVQTSIDDSMERNKQRALSGGPKIPAIAFYTYRKNFEEPNEEEGFKLIKINA